MISGDKFYAASMSSIEVAGQDLGLPASSFGDAFVDTGGDALWLPQATFDAVVAKIGSDANFTKLFGPATAFFKSDFDACVPLVQSPDELDAMLPPLTLTFAGGVTVQAPATSAYLMNFPGCGYSPALFTRGANNDGLPPIEMGAPILHNKLIVIDRANQRIGFAPAPCK
jgi:Xylanase inhibitor C-terminal